MSESTEWRGNSPPFAYMDMSKKILSLFFDESGDFGPYSPHSPYYIISIVCHEQDNDISEYLKKFDYHLNLLGYPDHMLHAGPLIRRERPYVELLMEERARLFKLLFNLMRQLPVKYGYIILDKRNLPPEDIPEMVEKKLKNYIYSKKDYFNSFDILNSYYDNGQTGVANSIRVSLGQLSTAIDHRIVKPYQYRLFQISDLACTLALLNEKYSKKILTKWEKDFFGNSRNLYKSFIRPLHKKLL